MDQGLERVLRLVAEGRLTAEEAGPILDALGAADHLRSAAGASAAALAGATEATSGGDVNAKFARIEIREGGKRVVDLRIPVSLGRFALGRVPGLSIGQLTEIEQAVATGTRGPILDVEDADGDGVRIVLE
jgi:hypothetical protein